MQENRQSLTSVVFVGSFDPFHEGHHNIVTRALKIFGKVIIGVGMNPNKKYMFTAEERVEKIKRLFAEVPNVEIEAYSDLTIDFAHRHKAVAIIKGVRNSEDYIYEQKQAAWNKEHGDIDTLIMITDKGLEDVSSTAIREIINNNDQNL